MRSPMAACEPCIGRGTFFPHTFAGVRTEPGEAARSFADHLELIVRAIRERVLLVVRRAPCADQSADGASATVAVPAATDLGRRRGVDRRPSSLAARLGRRLMLPTVSARRRPSVPAVELYEQWDHGRARPGASRIGCVTHRFVHRVSAQRADLRSPAFARTSSRSRARRCSGGRSETRRVRLRRARRLHRDVWITGEVVDRMGRSRRDCSDSTRTS